jgi:hypothetical protein
VQKVSKSNNSVIQYPVKTDIKLSGELWNLIGIKRDRLGMGINVSSLPFAPEDVTAGSESELQTVIIGKKSDVDLPIFIEQSNYLNNIRRRAKSGDTSTKMMTDLEGYLNENHDGVWENSWVRFPLKKMGKYAKHILLQDFLADKENPAKGYRTDVSRFLYQQNGEEYLRIPVSYLLKLAIAQALDPLRFSNFPMAKTGLKIMDKFLNDNTSPETSSFYVISALSEKISE